MAARRQATVSTRPKAVIHHNELVAMKRPFAACDKLGPDQSNLGRIPYGQRTIADRNLKIDDPYP
jgi:hypothetical protein